MDVNCVLTPHPSDYSDFLIYVKQIYDDRLDFNVEKSLKIHTEEIFKCLRSINEITVVDDETPPRRVRVRFLDHTNDSKLIWGEFQAHRKLLGLICVAFGTFRPVGVSLTNGDDEKKRASSNFGDIFAETLNDFKQSTVLDSRCALFSCLNTGHEETADRRALHSAAVDGCAVAVYDVDDFAESLRSFKKDVEDFVKGLFWVLESRRLRLFSSDQSSSDVPHCPMAPDEEKFFVGVDRSSRLFRKRCIGRLKKQLADCTLLTGLPLNALDIYSSAIELLKSANDFLWLAGAQEGYACALFLVKYFYVPRIFSSDHCPLNGLGLRRVSTICSPENHRPSTLTIENLFVAETKLSRTNSAVGEMDISSANLPSHCEHKNGFSSPKRPTSVTCKTGSSCNVIISRFKAYSNTRSEDIEDRFKAALENYRKFSIAVGIECECAMRASVLYVQDRRYLSLDTFLRDNCCTRFLSEDFRNFADEQKIYPVLLQSMRSYLAPHSSLNYFSTSTCLPISVDKSAVSATVRSKGWPAISIRAFHELYVAAQCAHHTDASIRHLIHFIHTTMEHIEDQLLKQLCTELMSLNSREIHETNVALKVVGGIVLQPISLTKLPMFLSFEVSPLPAYLIPKAVEDVNFDEIFIYTPLNQPDDFEKNPIWVVDCSATIDACLKNLLPEEIAVRNMVVHCEGIAYDASPTELVLPAFHEISAKLMVTPRSAGFLTVTGYSCQFLNIKSTCKLEELEWLNSDSLPSKCKGKKRRYIFDSNRLIRVRVIEALPLLSIDVPGDTETKVSCQEFDSTEIFAIDVQLYAGQRSMKIVKISNDSDFPIRDISYEIVQPVVSGGPSLLEIVDWPLSDDAGLCPRDYTEIQLAINGIDPLAVTDSTKFHNEIYNREDIIRSIPYTGRILTASLKLTYVGVCHDSEKNGAEKISYERTCSMTINVTIVPVVVVVDWNVLPGENSDNRYLALDIINACNAEIEVDFSMNKTAIVQPKDICRIPILCQCCEYKKPDFSNFPTSRGPMIKQYVLSARHKLLQTHLMSQLDVRWKKSSVETGLVPLGYLVKFLSLRDDLFISPFSIEVKIGREEDSTKTDFSCNIGLPTTLRFVLGCSDKDLSLIGQCTLNCYQDLQNGFKICSDQIVWLGNSSHKFNLHETCSEYECVFEFLFLSEGVYKIEAKFDYNNSGRKCVDRLEEETSHLPCCFPTIPVYCFTAL